MSNSSLVRLGDILTKAPDTVVLDPESEYVQVTARLWGNGITERGRVKGAEISATTQNRVHSGQFLISKIDARNGASGIVPEELEGAVVSNDFPVFDINSRIALPSFIGWMSKSAWFIRLCKQVSEGSTNRVRLREDRFLDLEIALPSLEEQHRLAARLDGVISNTQAGKSAREEMASDLSSTLRTVFGRIIADAPRQKMGDVAPLVRRPVEVDPEGEYPELGVRSFGRGIFDKPVLKGSDLSWQKLFRIEEGDLVLSNIKAWEGAFAVARGEHHGMVGSHRYLTCVPDSSKVSADFVYFYLQTPEGLTKVQQASPGSADRNRTLRQRDLENIEVPVPSLDAQQSFDALQAKARAIRSAMLEADAEAEDLIPALLNEVFGQL